MTSSAQTRPTLREISREAVRARITEVALDLFAEHGFDHVTVEQIAAAAGMSARSFHRYFPAKEDVVIGDPTRWGEHVRDALAARPADEPVWESLRLSFEALLVLSPDRDEDERGKISMQILGSTASLRARNLEKHLLWAQMLTPIVAGRLRGENVNLRADVIVQAALAAFDVALTTWSRAENDDSSLTLLAQAFATLVPRT
jgi:AcrR family transcriptional regulator